MRRLNKPIEQTELNLAPMMDLFVALIPFLIVSSSFIQLGGFEMQAPSAATSTAQAPSKNDQVKEIWLAIEVTESQVKVTGYEKDFAREIPGIKSQFALTELKQLTDYVSSLTANSNSKMGPSLFHASPETKYENAVAVLNALRSSPAVTEMVMAAGVVE